MAARIVLRRLALRQENDVEKSRAWLLLAYKVPRKPTAARVYIWRKLKKLGALALQDAVWVLPSNPQTLEHFRWLAAEITELNGEATLWESKQLLEGQDKRLSRQFDEQVRPMYDAILKSVKGKNPDLTGLSAQYQQALSVDHMKCALGQKVRSALMAAKREVQE